MGIAQSSGLILTKVLAGTGSSDLAPPWSRKQVQWIGSGFFVLRVAGDHQSRWLVGGCFSWNQVFPHERTFRRSAEDKKNVMQSLKMNPWPSHLACDVSPNEWRQNLSRVVEGEKPVLDTGYVTLWRLDALPENLLSFKKAIVLDGHHSRKAQQSLGLERIFGWVEPLYCSQLHVKPIIRAGWLAKWLDVQIAAGSLRRVSSSPKIDEWQMGKSLSFEVIQSAGRWWCEVSSELAVVKSATTGEELLPDTVVDILAKLGRGKTFLKANADFDEAMNWLERSEVDTVLRLPDASKQYIFERAISKRLFPQKATYFYPKLPFGILVEDLSQYKF